MNSVTVHLSSMRVIAEPEKKFGHDRARQADEQSHQEDARVEIQLDPGVWLYGRMRAGCWIADQTPYFCMRR